MNDRPIKNEADLKEYIREAGEEREQLRAQLADARELDEETARETYSLSLADFHERGSRQIQDLADQYGLTWIDAAERFGNALAPRPPDLTRRTPLGPDGEMFAPSDPSDPDAGDKALFGFSSGEAHTLASERGITKDEAAKMLARRSQPEPSEEA